MAPIDLQSLISNKLIPRDSNFQETAPLVGINPADGTFVPLKLVNTGDGTYSLAVNIAGATLPPIELGKVIIQGIIGANDYDLGAHANGDGTYSLQIYNAVFDTALSNLASEDTLSTLQTQSVQKTTAGNQPTDVVLQTDILASSPIYVTTDLFANAASYNVRGYKSKTLTVLNVGAKPAEIQMLASVDGGASYDVVAVSSVILPAGGTAVIKDTDYETNIIIQARSKTAGMSTSISTKIARIPI